MTVFRDGAISRRACQRGARLRAMVEAALAVQCRGVSLRSGIFQTLCRGLQDFARKLLVRYGASHTDRTDQRAIGQDCLRSCTAFVRPVPFTNQSCEKLNVVQNFPADECASAFVCACESPCEMIVTRSLSPPSRRKPSEMARHPSIKGIIPCRTFESFAGTLAASLRPSIDLLARGIWWESHLRSGEKPS